MKKRISYFILGIVLALSFWYLVSLLDKHIIGRCFNILAFIVIPSYFAGIMLEETLEANND